MTTVKEAAESNAEVKFKICYLEETKLGKKETPALKIAMKCTLEDDTELEGWLSHVIWGTSSAAYFAQEFLASLDKENTVYFENGEWHYSQETLKFSAGYAKISLNPGGYPVVEEWIENGLEKKKPIKQESTIIVDDDLPF